MAWRARLAPYYAEQGLDPEAPIPASNRAPSTMSSAHWSRISGPRWSASTSVCRNRAYWSGEGDRRRIISSATTVAEARWLEERGCDAIIAMGFEAGGHRGTFLSDDLIGDMTRQVGTFALVPQVVDAVKFR